MTKRSELSAETKLTYGSVRDQLKHTTETIDRRTDEARARVAALRATLGARETVRRRESIPDLDIGAAGLKGK